MVNELGKKTDEIVLKLLHYFVTEEGYNPIVLHGAKDEIWLEKLNSNYQIVRIVTNYIHNDEQLNFDQFKTTKILKKIKQKTLILHMNTLNIFLNVGESVNIKNTNKNMALAYIKKISDLNKYPFIIEVFPQITEKTKFKEKGMNLFMKITKDLNIKNEKENKVVEQTFKLKKPVLTFALIGINILIFILMYILGDGSDDVLTLLKFGANYKPLVLYGDYYRIFTSAFLHIGFLHLLFNCYGIYIIGSQIESYYGKIKYIGIYLFSIISAGLLSLVFSTSISAGASGAIFGLLGALLYFGYHYRVYLGTALKNQIIPLILINLVYGFLMPGIDNAAHVGGLIGGFLIAMALGVLNKTSKQEKINGIIMSIIYIVFLIILIFK